MSFVNGPSDIDGREAAEELDVGLLDVRLLDISLLDVRLIDKWTFDRL